MKAIVFDTNFLYESLGDINPIILKLIDKGFTPYLTQIAVDERVAQKIKKINEKYDQLCSIKNELNRFVQIEVPKIEDSCYTTLTNDTFNEYSVIFKGNIIPMLKKENLLHIVFKRACYKIPPFINESNSDKGFKDTLMWLSIVDFFKNKSDTLSEVIFIENCKCKLDTCTVEISKSERRE